MAETMTPLYGFLEGDTIGLLVLAYPDDTMGDLVEKLKAAASVRVGPRPGGQLVFKGQVLDAALTLSSSSLMALDRIDVRFSSAPLGGAE